MRQTVTYRSCRRRHGGFTLAEILIAIGILTIGLAMVASVFPAAVNFSNASLGDLVGDMIARNGLAVAQAVLQSGDISSGALVVLADEANTTLLSAASQHYPQGTASCTRGFVLLGRTTTPNAVQLIAVAYQKRDAAHTVTAQTVTGTTSDYGDASQFLVSAGWTYVRSGSPILHKSTGQWARIVGTRTEGSSNYALLDRRVSWGSAQEAFVIVESSEAAISPALAVLSTRLGL